MTKKSSASCSLAANLWTEKSILFAQQHNYLDELFRVYPINPEIERELDLDAWQNVENFFKKEKRRGLDSSLVKNLRARAKTQFLTRQTRLFKNGARKISAIIVKKAWILWRG